MTKYVLDTNIISFIIRGEERVVNKFLAESDQGNTCILPLVVVYEITRGLLAQKAKAKLKNFEEALEDFPIGEISPSVWYRAAEIYAELQSKGKRSEDDADLLIAAFCLINNYTLVTNNTKDFENIEGLKIVDWK